MAKAWGGRFQQATNPLVEAFTESISFDQRLYSVDIRGSKAHATMLAQVGLISGQECDQICTTLDQIHAEIDAGQFRFSAELEDIHMHIESALIARIGDVGRKLHTGRSRNDQVSTDLKLYVRDAIDLLDQLLARVQQAFVERCDQDADVVLPGYTHLQRAQPVLAAHYWLAYCEKFERDRQRLSDCRRRVNVSPLGAAALAGTSLPIDRHLTAKLLGFDSVAGNSLDVSSDRDHLAEFAFCLSLIAAHLSTWCEEWILWFTSEFGFLRLPDNCTTGSSIMPQKRNPDVAELLRASSAAVRAARDEIEQIMLLPSGYHRDAQLTKAPLLRGVRSGRNTLRIAAHLVRGLVPTPQPLETPLYAAAEAYRRDKPFREAYRDVAAEIREGRFNALPAPAPTVDLAALRARL